MAPDAEQGFISIFTANRQQILSAWTTELDRVGFRGTGRMTPGELEAQTSDVLDGLLAAARGHGLDPRSPGYARLRDILSELSRQRALQGFTPTETAVFVFGLKKALFDVARSKIANPADLAEGVWAITTLIDDLGLHTIEVFQRRREEVIIRQQREISELSTPVVKLWDGVLALPLIGTLDSERTQVVMENLLQSLVDHSAEIAIIDITGVPTVDTLVAQHLLKTVAAARLMGADCIVSGIRPQIAQTMVHLGVELNVVSKATLADAFALALQRIGRTVVAVKSSAIAG